MVLFLLEGSFSIHFLYIYIYLYFFLFLFLSFRNSAVLKKLNLFRFFFHQVFLSSFFHLLLLFYLFIFLISSNLSSFSVPSLSRVFLNNNFSFSFVSKKTFRIIPFTCMRYLLLSSLCSSICSSVVSSLSSSFLVSVTFVFLFFHLFSLSRTLCRTCIWNFCNFLFVYLFVGHFNLCVFACLSFLSVFFFFEEEEEEKSFHFCFYSVLLNILLCLFPFLNICISFDFPF